MSLGLPLGLLGLLGIAALIIIYILKPKYTDKAVSSTFVWMLTLKYKKKKLPFQWLRSSLLLILQLIIIAILALALAQPLFMLPAKSGEKIVILDASASMLTQKDGRTRFDRALADIARLAESGTPNNKFSVILAGDEATALVTRSDSAGFIKQSLSGVTCTYGSADIEGAMEIAENILKENTAAEIILYTGREYPGSGITVKNMSDNEWNAAILNFKADISDGYYAFYADVASYNQSADLSVALEIDGKYADVKSVRLTANKAQTVEFKMNTLSYGSARVYLTAADDFTYDNEFCLFGGDKQNFKVQLISKAPLFLGLALRNAQDDIGVTVPGYTDEARELIMNAGSEEDRLALVAGFTIDDYLVEYTGYDLYVFERMTPELLPTDGTVWLINPTDAVAPANSGLTFGARASGSFTLSASGASGEPYDTILNYLSASTIAVSEYRRVLEADGYEEIMYVNDSPVILARRENGVKTVLIAFDFHNTGSPISPELPILVVNLCKYSLARTTDNYVYNVGAKVQINASTAATQIAVEGGGATLQFDTFPANVTVKQNGEYTVKQTLPTRISEEKFFVRIAASESDFSLTGQAIKKPVVSGTAVNTVSDTVDIFFYLAIAMLVIISVEWGLQHREQY